MKVYFALVAALLLAGCATGERMEKTDRDSATEVMALSVGPEKVDCVGVGPMQCLIVNGSMFYDRIRGFEYEEGYQYELLVERTARERSQIPADASRYRYELIEVKSKTEVMP